MMKKKVLPVLGLVLAAAVLLGAWYFTRPAAQEGEKYLRVDVIHSGSVTVHEFTTDAETLAGALLEQEIVEDNQTAYGLYILTADGVTADESKQEWWCITRGGQSVTTGASEIMIADGDVYELTLTVGYGS